MPPRFTPESPWRRHGCRRNCGTRAETAWQESRTRRKCRRLTFNVSGLGRNYRRTRCKRRCHASATAGPHAVRYSSQHSPTLKLRQSPISGTRDSSGEPSLSPGARLGHYEIVGLIGAGGMGQVYRARDTKLQREDALNLVDTTTKVSRPAYASPRETLGEPEPVTGCARDLPRHHEAPGGHRARQVDPVRTSLGTLTRNAETPTGRRGGRRRVD